MNIKINENLNANEVRILHTNDTSGKRQIKNYTLKHQREREKEREVIVHMIVKIKNL